jgi:hypothetical protein
MDCFRLRLRNDVAQNHAVQSIIGFSINMDALIGRVFCMMCRLMTIFIVKYHYLCGII